MLKFLQLGCITTVFFTASFCSTLQAQTVQDSTATETDAIAKIRKKEGIIVKGIVKNAKNKKGIAGANIEVKGFSSAITEDDGSFKINVPHLESVLLVSGPDFQTKVCALQKRDSNIEIVLFESNYAAFYQTSNSSGSLMQYGSTQAETVVNFRKDQWSSPIADGVSNFLQGKVAGLNITRNTGVPTSGANMSLRGFTSLNATNKPLIIVDGMIYDDEDYGSGIIKNTNSSPLTNIDVKDIEDVTVLKDASSLYGTKGANGAIVITTTRPIDLTTKIDFIYNGGVNFAPKQLPLLGATSYRSYISQLAASSGDSQDQVAALPFMNDNVDYVDYYKFHNNTNWQDQVFKASQSQNYFLKVRGGDNIAKYGLSVGYVNEKGIIDKSESSRLSTRLNASLKLSNRLTVDSNMSFVSNIQNQLDQGYAYNTSPLYLALTKSPLVNTNLVDEFGNVSPRFSDTDYFKVGNPNEILSKAIGINKNYRFFGNLNFKYLFNESWNFNTLFGLTFNKEREQFFYPNYGVLNSIINVSGFETELKNRSGSEIQSLFSIYTDSYFNFSKKYANSNKVDARIGFRSQKSKSESDTAYGYNSATDDFVNVGSTNLLLRQVGGALGEWTWLNLYGDAKYNYRDKYFLNASCAVDGSSRFGDDATTGKEQYSVMSSIGGAWMVSAESFMKHFKFIDYLKLRVSYGLTGNDDVGNFTAPQYYISQNILGIQGLVRGNISNPDLKWETVEKTNLGVDFGLFKEKLNVTLDAFYNKTNNMLMYQNVGIVPGFETVLSNSGSMRTIGAEMTLNSRIINTPDMTFDLGLTLASYRNKMLATPGESIYTQFAGATYVTEVGNTANAFYGLQSNGVYASTALAQADGLSRRLSNGSLAPFAGGDMKYTDINGDKVIDNKDRVVIGNPNPDVTGSFSTNFTYKRFSVQGLFTFSVGNDLYNGLRYNLEKMSGVENQTIAVENRWRTEGQQTDVPKATWADPMGNSEFSSRWIEDGSYFRLKTFVISYDLSRDKWNYLKSLKIYATFNNLFTLTKYLGYDPEFSATASVFGKGADVALTPQFKSMQLGIRLGL